MEFHIPDEVLQTDEKQEINLRTKKKSTVQRKSSLPSSLISLKQLSSKHKKVAKKVESIEGQVGNKPKPNVKKARKTVKRKSESEKPGSIEEGCNDKSERSAELSEDGTKITNKNEKRTSGSEDTDGEGWSKQKSAKKLTKVGTAEAKETGKPETKQDGSGEDSGKNKPALNHNTDSISSTVHEFVRPKAMSKEKPNEKDNPQEGMVVEAQKEGPAEVIQVNGTSSDIESQASIKQVKDKQRKRKTDKKLENVQGGTGTNEDTEDEALEDPFVNNQSLLHCKFSTTIDLSSMDHKLFTPVYYPDAPSTPSIDADKTTISKTLKRVGRMKSKGLTAPILLTNSSEVALINNCSLFVRPKGTSGDQGNVCDIDVPIDTQGSDQSSDILAPRSLEVILKNPPTFDAYLNVNNEFNASDIQLCTLILEAANEMKGLGTSKALLKVFRFSYCVFFLICMQCCFYPLDPMMVKWLGEVVRKLLHSTETRGSKYKVVVQSACITSACCRIFLASLGWHFFAQVLRTETMIGKTSYTSSVMKDKRSYERQENKRIGVTDESTVQLFRCGHTMQFFMRRCVALRYVTLRCVTL